MQERKRIVVADDSEEICDLLMGILTELGYEVDSVYNGYALLKYLEKNTPSVIILDLMMPEKDGISIFATLKQVSPYSRIIIYTGYQEYEDSVYAREADKFLVKGGSMEELITAIEELT